MTFAMNDTYLQSVACLVVSVDYQIAEGVEPRLVLATLKPLDLIRLCDHFKITPASTKKGRIKQLLSEVFLTTIPNVDDIEDYGCQMYRLICSREGRKLLPGYVVETDQNGGVNIWKDTKEPHNVLLAAPFFPDAPINPVNFIIDKSKGDDILMFNVIRWTGVLEDDYQLWLAVVKKVLADHPEV